MSSDTPRLFPCPHCQGTGQVPCDCPSHYLRTVEGHPLNQRIDMGSSWMGYCVQQCQRCGRVWGLDYQFDAGTGSDDYSHDYGFGDPLVIATERVGRYQQRKGQ